MQANQQEWKQFYDVIRRKANLDLDLYRAGQLQRRVLSMVETQGLKSLTEFATWTAASQDNLNWFLDKMAINVSELFRNPEKWTEMENTILPELLKTNKSLKIWSAGCSYGAEAHSLAMVLDAKFPGNHRIIGSDIDQAALAQAQRGEFSEADVRCVPAAYKNKYLRKEGNSYFADAGLKKYLTFKKGNLLADRFDSGFDLICCRNVVIYFTDDAKDALYQRFYEALRPGGILFVGSTERVAKARELGLDTALPFFYRKPNQGDNAWRIAS